MNFEFSEEQNMLREQAQGFLKDHCPTAAVRTILDGDEPFDRNLWRSVVDMGWVATTIPEEFDGLGLGYLELSVIAEELGRVFAPLPFSSSVYLATEALLGWGSRQQKEAWLPKLANGTAIGCFAVAEGGGHTTAGSIQATVADGVLSGRKTPVTDGDIADFAIVIANGRAGPSAWIVALDDDGVTRSPVATLDPTRSHASIELRGVRAELLGQEGEGWSLLEQVYNRAAVLFAWEQVGGAETALQMAKEYALGRFAFGRPIASYQAIKHKLVNMYVKNTLARSNCYYGSWALSTGAPDLPIAAAAARVAAIQAYHFAAKENIQTHGGMGFTWEFDCQIPYRRSRLLAVNLGSEAVWQEKLIAAIETSRAA